MVSQTRKYQLELRRSEKFTWSKETNSRTHERGVCPDHSWGHDTTLVKATATKGSKKFKELVEEWLPKKDGSSSHGYSTRTGKMKDKAWFSAHKKYFPTECSCGYKFQDDDEWQIDWSVIWKREDTGEEIGPHVHKAPAGAMYWAPWLDRLYKPQLEHCLVVILPGGHGWVIDSQATNCTMPEDSRQEKHHCWIITGGPPPKITAGKGGPTCSAGAGSIAAGDYHGFLQDGVLT